MRYFFFRVLSIDIVVLVIGFLKLLVYSLIKFCCFVFEIVIGLMLDFFELGWILVIIVVCVIVEFNIFIKVLVFLLEISFFLIVFCKFMIFLVLKL